MRQKKSTLGERLALLSVKYSVYPAEVFQALVTARSAEKAVCGNLRVEYRGEVKGELIFLIKKEEVVVAQFRVDKEFLFRKDNPFDSWMSTEKIRKKIAKQSIESIFSKVQDLKAGMKRVNLKVEVLDIPKPAQVLTQFGNTVMVVNALVGDETGKIKLCLWEAQINSISSKDHIEIKNAHVCLFRGEKQLRLGKNGALSILRNPEDIKQQLAAQIN